MTLQAFLLAVYGKQGKKEEGEEKKLKMEVLIDIGIQRLVAYSALTFQTQYNQLFDIIMHACM